jgi:methylmalonyl-CoA mutase N-terminal domain/subunit
MQRPNQSASLAEWQRECVAPVLRRSPERRDQFSTLSGLEIPRLGVPASIERGVQDEASRTYLEQLGFPGEFPFTRGVQPTMYRGRLWTMRQYAGFGTAEETNRRYHYLLERGQTGLSVAFDLPTQMGLDSDHPLARGEVGKVGVAIDSVEDMAVLLDRIPLDRISISMTINATASTLLAMVIAVARRRGSEVKSLRGTTQNDILKEYIARGTFIYPPGPSMRIVTDMFAYCSAELPQWNPISISGYHIREAGSTAVQEVAFTLANGLAYVRAAIDAGQKPVEFAPRLSFFFNVHNHFLEEIAKFRAARRLWARLLLEKLGVTDPDSLRLRFHAQTAGSTLTRQQPENNVVRVALQALAAVLGGAQSLHTNGRDEALALPTEESARIALRTQQILACETGVADSIDPLGGAYLIEELTDRIEREAHRLIEAIEALGGAVAAIEARFVQREIGRAAYETQKAIERGDQQIVGVNAFTEDDERPRIETLRVGPELEADQVQRLAEHRQRRQAPAVDAALAGLEAAARGAENLMPRILASVEAGATVGEISDRLRSVFGVYRDSGEF